MMKKSRHDGSTPDTTPAVPRLQRRTLRQLSMVELGKVAAGRRATFDTITTAVENDCLTRD